MKLDEQLQILLNFGQAIAKENRLDAILSIMADFAREILDADRCSIFMYDKEKEELWTKVAHQTKEIRVPLRKGVAGFAALSKEIQIVVDAYNDFRFNKEVDINTGYNTKTILAVPLLNSDEEVVGVFQALNKQNGLFSKHDAQLLLLLSNYASASIETALLYEKLQETQKKIIIKISHAAEFKDEDTSKHIKRVGLFSAMLARAYGLEESTAQMLELTASMHDAGKIGIPDKILLKPGRLDEAEFRVMRTHAMIGYNLLHDKEDVLLQNAALIAREHHEKFDGSGYPDGLKAEEISIFGRIVAIADVFDALTTTRPYKRPWPFDDAVSFIKEQSGKHFDPQLVELFIQNIEQVRFIYEEYKD